MLGFKRTIFPQGDHVADWVADISRGLHSLYVYCPLVEPRMVGDAQVQLLRIVPVEGRDTEMVTKIPTYRFVYYMHGKLCVRGITV
jgi:hypothetical protein